MRGRHECQSNGEEAAWHGASHPHAATWWSAHATCQAPIGADPPTSRHVASPDSPGPQPTLSSQYGRAFQRKHADVCAAGSHSFEKETGEFGRMTWRTMIGGAPGAFYPPC